MIGKRGGLWIAGLLVFALACPAGRLFGQAVFGSIIGTVTDEQGASVPNAKITITNVAQNVSYETTSNESGNYEQQHLIAGVYRVHVEVQGFEAYTQEGVQVNVDSATQVNVPLKVGAQTTTIDVTAAVPLLKTEKTDVAENFSEKQVEDLPIFNRNFVSLQLLTPGSQRLGWQHAASENPQGAIQIMMNGQHFSGTDYTLDGTSNQDPILGIIVINPNLDSVTEAKITTQNYDAEFGKATAGIVSSQTKSGTNEWHGDAFEFNRTNATSARDPFTQCGADCGGVSNVAHSVWNQYGGSAGGPIKKDKIFVFGDYQGTRRSLGGSGQARVPTAAERAGDYSALAAAASTNIFNPFNPDGSINPCISLSSTKSDGSACRPADLRQQFMGNDGKSPNVIPSSFLATPDAVAASKMLANIPMPNVTPPHATDNNYFASGAQTFNSWGLDGRTDWYVNDKLHMLGRYSIQQFSRQGAGLFGSEVGGPNLNVDPSLGGFAGSSSVRNQSLAYGFDRTLGPTWLTDFRFGFVRYRVFVNPNGVGTSPAKDAGIAGLNLDNYYTSGMPHFQIQGTGGLDWGYSLGVNQCNCPLNEQEQQFQFVNNWTNIRGNHTIKFGADIRYATNLRVPSDSHRSGEIYFSPGFTQGCVLTGADCTAYAGMGLATYQLGAVTSFSRYVSHSTNAKEAQKRWLFYGQDTWRVTPKLTVNYGLRWEIYFPQTVNAAGNGGWVQVDTGEVWVAGAKGIGMDGNVSNTYKNFAPRLGIAYQMDPKTVVRMGYGRSFDIGTFGSIFGHTVTQNVPVLANQSLNAPSGASDAFTLSVGPSSLDPSTILQNNCNAITLKTSTVNGTQCLGPTGNPLNPDGISPHVHPKNQRLLTVDAWNVTVQRALSNTMSAEVGYVANKGSHVFIGDGPNYNINDPTLAGFTPGRNNNPAKPYYAKLGWTQGVCYYGNDASNNYESLQAKLDKRFGSGYQIEGTYTFAHANQYTDSYYIYNPSLVYGPSDFQRHHVLTITNVITLPFGKGQKYMSSPSRLADLLLGGWQINGAWIGESGTPETAGYQDRGSDADTGPGFPNRTGSVGAGTRSGNPAITGYWFQTAAHTLAPSAGGTCPSDPGCTSNGWTRPGVGTFGNAGENSLWGPRSLNADISFFKNFTLTERVKMQLRAESFNTFNHVNLGGFDSCVDCSTAGRITDILGSSNMREWQFGLRLEF
ncbi:MAG TPA: TonB-dependent receptor [Terriglobia bacterium]|nr:TonB-dependent receptor [Terriglobia bacterium]